MKKKKVGLIVIGILLVVFGGIPFTYSRLNLTFTKDMALVSKPYVPLTITNTRQLEENSYEISLKNENDYEITFSCEDIESKFNIVCSTNTISAKSMKNITVDLDFKDGVDKSTLTPNPDGSGYITQLGIRITAPYFYPISDPHYAISNNMIVVELTITNLLNHVKSLANTDTTNLAKDHVTNIRYIGANPNNYISFNNELWRIIGVVDDKVKIIRTTPYSDSAMFYDGSDAGTKTEFQNAAIKTELNDMFYYSMNSKYRGMIKEGKWNVGGLNTWDWQVAGTAYNTEKTSVISANIGLISATDYVYAIGGDNRTACIESKSITDVSSCNSSNWLYPYAANYGMWTINKFTGAAQATVFVNTLGNVSANPTTNTAAAYPVLYLDETVGFTSGDGTEANPYRVRGNSKPVVSNTYIDSIIQVYVGTWAPGNELAGFAGKEITSFDKVGGALMFSNDTWGIRKEYTITHVYVYSYNDQWALNPLAIYVKNSLKNDNGNVHDRPSNYLFRRHIAPDLNYIGSDALEQHNGSLRFIIIVK